MDKSQYNGYATVEGELCDGTGQGPYLRLQEPGGQRGCIVKDEKDAVTTVIQLRESHAKLP